MSERKQTLDELAIKYCSDKSSLGHDYCRRYEEIFGHLRDASINILELGYGGYADPNAGGESARMWREYFPNARIVVTDIHNKTNVPDGVIFVKGDQRYVYDATKGPFSIIVDDASHENDLTVESFKSYWHTLKSGGYYIIEDLHAAYLPNHYKNASTNPDLGATSMNFFKRLTDDLNKDWLHKKYHLDYEIDSLTFYRELCVIKKK